MLLKIDKTWPTWWNPGVQAVGDLAPHAVVFCFFVVCIFAAWSLVSVRQQKRRSSISEQNKSTFGRVKRVFILRCIVWKKAPEKAICDRRTRTVPDRGKYISLFFCAVARVCVCPKRRLKRRDATAEQTKRTSGRLKCFFCCAVACGRGPGPHSLTSASSAALGLEIIPTGDCAA